MRGSIKGTMVDSCRAAGHLKAGTNTITIKICESHRGTRYAPGDSGSYSSQHYHHSEASYPSSSSLRSIGEFAFGTLLPAHAGLSRYCEVRG